MKYIQSLGILLTTDLNVLNVKQSEHIIHMALLLAIQGGAEDAIYVSGADIIEGSLLNKKRLLKGKHLLMKIVKDGGLQTGIQKHPQIHMFLKIKLRLTRGGDDSNHFSLFGFYAISNLCKDIWRR